ncbi:peptidoglycan editing factor PgeF [Caldibacillus lycopersici]|uniref:Purine nucleoside phosphorylase n=1 Tax=Perspicuibacillus lycopersici TaxID=1325689 RepID=A0AAE3IRQ1_9BACI|nr:peptidoglycan editing factor PgeF [Perspicuibacillus lycopersici]MCU9612186.1 peptidoglycan editing factor PgeF [Perspicuibacillus lycopersici]
MLDAFQLDEETFFLINSWQAINPKIYAGFTTKNNGVSNYPYSSNNMGLHVGDKESDVCINRSRLAEKIQFPLEQWVCAEQTHGHLIQKVDENDCGKGAKKYENSIRNRDGLYTTEKNVLLALCYADCVPIYFYEPKSETIGMVHAGWRGTVENISKSLLNEWSQNGIDLEDVLVVIGPSICKQCYIVDNKVIDQIEKLAITGTERYYSLVSENQYSLDLKGLNYFLLVSNGISEKNIQVTSYCTSCNFDYFYSHRRDKGKTGRMIGFIGIRED